MPQLHTVATLATLGQMDYQAKPYTPPVVNPKRSYPPAKPWMARRPDETPREHMRRLNRTCYHCGRYEKDSNVLDRHEAGHKDRS